MLFQSLKWAQSLCIAAFITLFVLAPVAAAQDHSALIGKWNMTSETEGDPVHWTLVLKDADGKLTAAMASEQGEMVAKNFSYADGVLKFSVPYEGEDYMIELKLTDAKLDGTWSGGGGSGKTYGTKTS
jgi:hypothetical protein